jgi:hypothetical protein
MSRRKPQAPIKRVAPPQGAAPTGYIEELYQQKLRESVPPRNPALTYEKFLTLFARTMVQYEYASAEEIPEFERLVQRRPMADGPMSAQQFADVLCMWTLHYKTDLDPTPAVGTFSRLDLLILFINTVSRLKGLGLRVGPSRIPGAGNGLFATRRWTQGDLVTYYGGYYASVDLFECLDFADEHRSYIVTVPIQYGGGIRDAQIGFRLCDMGRWANSSTAPETQNLDLLVIPGSNPPAFEMFAKRDIEEGEELLWDYGQFMRFPPVAAVECSICDQLAALSMCSACEAPICDMECHRVHARVVHARARNAKK